MKREDWDGGLERRKIDDRPGAIEGPRAVGTRFAGWEGCNGIVDRSWASGYGAGGKGGVR